ncbi:MAG: hypothetical protein JSV22_02300 [Bacteroidales bacterium]|nr:MAG: hypothetical protein JSV22_02300 [Bacteroidales bacterium]
MLCSFAFFRLPLIVSEKLLDKPDEIDSSPDNSLKNDGTGWFCFLVEKLME